MGLKMISKTTEDIKNIKKYSNQLADKVIEAVTEVYKILGPGLLQEAYEECLCYELSLRNITFKKQVPIRIKYKGVQCSCGYRLSLLVDNAIILDIKSVEKILPIHKAHLSTYLNLSNLTLGLLINFNVTKIEDGIKRLVSDKK